MRGRVSSVNWLFLGASNEFGEYESGLTAPIEFGAEFIHGHAEITRSWLARAGAAVIESSDSRFSLKDGVPTPAGGSFENVQQAVRSQAGILEREDMSFDRFVEEHLGMLSAQERAYAQMLAEGFDAVGNQSVGVPEQPGDDRSWLSRRNQSDPAQSGA